MKEWFSTLLLAVGLLALAACAAQEKAAPAPAAAPAAPAAQPAWQEEWERALAAAKREGKVVVNGQTGTEIRRALTEPFEKRYGITVEYLGLTGSQFAPRIRTEREAGQYLWDVYIGGLSTPTVSLKPVGALDPIEPALILPDVKDPRNWRGGELAFADKERLALMMMGNTTDAFNINPNLAKPEEFRSYKDLLDPKWKGKILAHDPRVSGGGQSRFQFFYLHRELGPDFIRALAKQDLLFSRNQTDLAQWLAQGKGAILVGSSGEVIKLIRAGAPIQVVDPRQLREGGTSGSPGTAGVLALINRAPHPNAAKVYINWLLTKEGQTGLARATENASRRLDVPTDFLEPWRLPVEGFMILDDEESRKQREEVLVPFLRDVFGR